MINQPPTLIVGIDPGLTTGISFYLPSTKKLIKVYSVPSCLAINEIKTIVNENATHRILFVVEDSNKDSTVFSGWKIIGDLIHGLFSIKNFFAFSKKVKVIEKQYRADMATAQRVGQNKGRSRDILEFLKLIVANVITIAPSSRRKAKKGEMIVGNRMPTKMTKKQFCEWTGWDKTKKADEHGMDAGGLIYGLTWPRIQLLINQDYFKNLKSKK